MPCLLHRSDGKEWSLGYLSGVATRSALPIPRPADRSHGFGTYEDDSSDQEQAVVQAAEEASEQVALGGGMPTAVGPAPLVGVGGAAAVRASVRAQHVRQHERVAVVGLASRDRVPVPAHPGSACRPRSRRPVPETRICT